MSADSFRSTDSLDRWWDAYQRGEITDGIPIEDMNLIQEITAMHAHAISSADEQRVWRRASEQIKQRQEGAGTVQRLLRHSVPQVFGWPIGQRRIRPLAVVSIVAVVGILSLILGQLTGNEERPAIFAPGDATPAATESGDVPMYRGNAARTGVMPGPGPENTPDILWQTQLQGSIKHQPLLVDGTIYIDDSGGWIYAIDAFTGAIDWQIATGVGGESAIAAGYGMIYVTTFDGSLLALNAMNGEEVWRDDRARPRFAAIVVGGRVIFDTVIETVTGNEDGAVITLDAATGQEIDMFTFPGAFRNMAAISDGVIYGIDLRGIAYAYDLTSHERIWRVEVGSQSIEPITIAGGVAYVPLGTSNENGQVVALDAASGEEIWRRGTVGDVPVGAAIVTEGTYYACSLDGTMYANNADDGGVQFFEADVNEDVVAAPVFADGTLFIAGTGGRLVGTQGLISGRWQVTLPGSIEAGPTVADGLLWVGTTEGVLYALGEGGTSLAASSGVLATPGSSTPSPTHAEVEWSSSGDAVILMDPLDIAHDSEGNVYVVDAANEQIIVLDSAGNFLAKLGSFGEEPGLFHFPDYDAGVYGDIDVGPGDKIYVADPFNHRIQVFDREYQFMREWGSAGTGEGQFNRPTGVLVANDRIYVSDFGNNRIQIFTLDGGFISQFGSFGADAGQFNGPAGLDADVNGNIYVAEVSGRRVQRFNLDGDYLGLAVGHGQIEEVCDIAVDSRGAVIAADGGAGQLAVFDPEGDLIAIYDRFDTGETMVPVGVAILEDGSIYVTDWAGQQRVVKVRVPEVSGSD